MIITRNNRDWIGHAPSVWHPYIIMIKWRLDIVAISIILIALINGLAEVK